MFEVKIPDPKEQYKKTPAYEYVRRKVEVVNPDGSKSTLYTRDRVYALRGTGMEARVLTLHEMVEEVLSDNAQALYVVSKAVNVNPVKPRKAMVPRKIILRSLLSTFKGKVESNVEDETALEGEFRDWAVRSGRWGLGCLNGCGRYWEFKPSDDLTGFIPVDPAAYRKYVDLDGKEHNGYLEWSPQPDGSVVFKCDRCGAEIKLTK